MARFLFSVCTESQVDDLLTYIDEHWAQNHIFCQSRTLFNWQHKSRLRDDYNFIIARRRADGRICGILGFIPTSHFSPDLADCNEIWLAIWKVNEGPKYIGLGIGLLRFLIEKYDVKSIYSVGISEIVRPIYQELGYTVGRLSQLVLINGRMSDFQIASIKEVRKANHLTEQEGYSIKVIDSDSAQVELASRDLYSRLTRKDITFIINRYLKHPVYRYRIFGVYHYRKLLAFLVTRVVHHSGSSAIRVVDIQGDIHSVSKVTKKLHELLVNENHEYLDIMSYGLPEEDYTKAGFYIRDQEKSIVIPDYFEPFVKKNIDIFFACSPNVDMSDVILFKGDADQDRPNRL